MTRIGFYNYDPELHWVLMESYTSISNRHIYHELLMAPFHAIQEAWEKKTAHPYILRERHRRWTEILNDEVGNWVELPSWDDLVSDEHDDCGLCAHLFEVEPEWILYGDDCELAFDLIDKLKAEVFVQDDILTVITALLKRYPETRDLILLVQDYGFYVIRSPNTESCGVEFPEGAWHPFQDLGNGEVAGEYLTYVLPDDIVKEYADAVLAEEKSRIERDLAAIAREVHA